MPTYDLNEFLQCCQDEPSRVVLLGSVEKDAEKYFNLKPRSAIIDFIGNGELEDLRFVNTKEWEKNPDKTNVIYVDAYEFRTMAILGYIAFMFSNKSKKWLIKSFHLSENTNPAIAIALLNIGFRRN